MSDKKERDIMEVFSQAEEVVRTFSKGKRFAEDLLRENERLRYKILDLQQQAEGKEMPGGGAVLDTEEENKRLRDELEKIKAHFDNLNRENKDFQSRYEEVEQQNENLLNLYVSGYQLHSTLQEDNVLAVIQEILLNLLGAEVFALWIVDQNSGELEPLVVVDESGLLGGAPPRITPALQEEMAAGKSVLFSGSERSEEEALACIPLQLEEKTQGVLVIYKLLEQKKSLTSLDQELLNLLTTQAATAILGSMALSRTGKKLRSLGEE
jgi:nitrate/nitrite-specific signal transduction histidine kinase